MELTNYKMLGIGAVLGIVTGTWEKIKTLLYRFYSLFVITMKVEGAAGYAMSMYLIRNFKRSRVGDIEIDGYNDYVRPVKRNQLIALRRIPNKAMIWWKGWKPMSVSREWETLKLRFVRGMFRPVQLVEMAVAAYNDNKFMPDEDSIRFFVARKQGTVGVKPLADWGARKGSADDEEVEDKSRHSVHTADKYTSEVIGWEFDDIGQPHITDAINRMSLTQDQEAAFEDIKRWKDSEGWFKERGIPWKTGCLLVGRPGTGKTMFVRSTGQALDMPIFIFDLATMTNQDFVEAWNRIMDWLPCIVMIDDIHAVFSGTHNITPHGEEAALSYDCLINTLDGVQNSEGVVIMITANDTSKVDPAIGGPDGDGNMLTRPGRVNRIVQFRALDDAGREKMARRILGDFGEETWRPLVKANRGTTGAQFEHVCTQLARKLWLERDPDAPPLTGHVPMSERCPKRRRSSGDAPAAIEELFKT